MLYETHSISTYFSQPGYHTYNHILNFNLYCIYSWSLCVEKFVVSLPQIVAQGSHSKAPMVRGYGNHTQGTRVYNAPCCIKPSLIHFLYMLLLSLINPYWIMEETVPILHGHEFQSLTILRIMIDFCDTHSICSYFSQPGYHNTMVYNEYS